MGTPRRCVCGRPDCGKGLFYTMLKDLVADRTPEEKSKVFLRLTVEDEFARRAVTENP
jgi:hypothetical protein